MKKLRYLLLALPLLGAWLSRWHGGGWGIKAIKIIKNALWALPFGVIVWLCGGAWWLCALTVALCLIGKATGHGRGLGSDEPLRDDMSPEKIERLILWLQPSLQDRAYKHIIMALTGFTAVSGAVVAFMFIDPLGALVVACGGLLKGLAYEIGTILLPKNTKSGIPHIQYKTEVGEFLTGVFAYTGVTIAYIIS